LCQEMTKNVKWSERKLKHYSTACKLGIVQRVRSLMNKMLSSLRTQQAHGVPVSQMGSCAVVTNLPSKRNLKRKKTLICENDTCAVIWADSSRILVAMTSTNTGYTVYYWESGNPYELKRLFPGRLLFDKSSGWALPMFTI
jgi:hypothetical protein